MIKMIDIMLYCCYSMFTINHVHVFITQWVIINYIHTRGRLSNDLYNHKLTNRGAKIYCQSNLTANQKRALCSTLPCQSNLTANQKSIVQYIALSIKFNSQSKESIVQYIALSIKFNSQSKESICHINTQDVWGTPIEVWTMGKLWQKIWSPVTIIPFIFGFPWLSQYWMAGRNYSEGGRLFLLV